MASIHYNSWMEQYKMPFGAAKKGTEITIGLFVSIIENPRVELLIHKDGEDSESSYLLNEKESHFYQTNFTPETEGLYFYYFKISSQDNGEQITYFYGAAYDGFGGEGRISKRDELFLYQLTCFEKDLVPSKWYASANFYQIFPDRFFNGNENEYITGRKKNSFIYATKEDTPYYIKDNTGAVVRWDFFGGNLQGIIKKIPYLKQLGITGVYLNPIFLATTNHRYDTNDFMRIDPMLGNENDFKELLDKLHSAGIHIILDGVFNHVGKDSLYFNARNLYYDSSQGAAQNVNSPYYSWFKFYHYPDEYASWWGVKDLPEVDKENTSYQQYIYGEDNSVLAKWTSMGVDGWRLDVADELPENFIKGIKNNLSEYQEEKVLLGEVWEDASNKIAHEKRRHYVSGNELDGVMNYPQRKCILDLLVNNRQRSIYEIARELMSLRENYPHNFYFNSLNNLGTHDTERILTILENDIRKLKVAWDLLYMLPGVPCIYYGDEVGMTGGKDPLNRGFYPWNKENTIVLNYVKQCIKRRKETEVLQKGDLIVGASMYCFSIIRYNQESIGIYVVNISEESRNLDEEEFTWYHDNDNLGEFIHTEFGNQNLTPYEGQWRILKRP
ncbi:glycoside hydrolase family 13 protein [Ligilactobacillus sp. WILCCON 0076]|uniref:Glycoside hydrolase family 13 protein n=1 Tax=Ligilactobacillus ubinensis TaxID=2876789 RepID=A0A9X2FKQ3_9LACO|nr:glycoside hydrolase family 13 protein [Ligilactobacillus ubinensis]MCP0886313.1 glycoside hydrolase family 13 protein [Ligilactobacillus ubinensis]